jgi:hypothetical protein
MKKIAIFYNSKALTNSMKLIRVTIINGILFCRILNQKKKNAILIIKLLLIMILTMKKINIKNVL